MHGTVQGRAYNLYDPSLGQTMNAGLVAAIYGNNIQPNVSTIPGTVRVLLCFGTKQHIRQPSPTAHQLHALALA